MIKEGALRFQGCLSAAEASKRGAKAGDNAGIGGGDSSGPLLNSRGELIGIASSQLYHYGG